MVSFRRAHVAQDIILTRVRWYVAYVLSYRQLDAVPRVIGLDEWAWRRGRRFGTMICDLERHHVLALLPERSASSAAQWLQTHPSVEIVCRDRKWPLC